MLLLVPNEPSATFTRVFLLEISNQDVKESQAWDKESSSLGQEESLLLQLLTPTPVPFPGGHTRAFTEAGKSELPFCWTANSQFKIQTLCFGVELWADTLVTL